MKKIIIGLIALLSFAEAFSQGGNDPAKYVWYRYTYGNRLARYWADTVLQIPQDTIWSKEGLALKGGTLYVGNGIKWSQVTGGGGGSADSAVFFTVYRSDTMRINLYNAIALKKNNADSVAATGYASHGRLTKVSDSLAIVFNTALALKKDNADSVAATGYMTHGRGTKVADSLAAVLNAAIALKKNNNDSVAATGYASHGRLTKVADSLAALIAGGGGAQTFPQVLNTGRTLAHDDSISLASYFLKFYGGNISMDSFSIVKALVRADSLIAFDNSIGAGTGASAATFRYLYLLAAKFRAALSDYSVGGTTMQVDGLAKIPLIPTYNPTLHRALIFGYYENDIINAGNNATLDTAHCGPISRQFVDAATAKGWPVTKIMARGPVWISPTNYVNATLVRQAQYQAMAQSLVTSRGIKFVDCYNPFVYRGTVDLMFDQVLHPNNTGHALIAQLAYNAYGGDSARSNGTAGIVNNRTTDVNTFVYQGRDTVSTRAEPLMVDTNGKVGRGFPDQLIKNSKVLPQAQAASINVTGTITAGNGINSTLPPSIYLWAPVSAQFGFARVTGSAPSGLTGAGLELAYSSNTAFLYGYDRTGAAAKNMSLSFLGGVTMVGTGTATGGPELLQVNGGTSSLFGRFQGNVSGTGLTGAATEIGYNTGSDYAFVYGYNRTSSAGKNLVLGAGLSPIVIVNGTAASGVTGFQVLSSGYVSGLLGIGINAPTAALHINRTVSSPTTGATGVDFAVGASTYTFAVDQTQVTTASIGQKTHTFGSAHTVTDASSFDIIGAPIAGTNATLTNSYAFRVLAGKSKFSGAVQIVDGTQQNGYVFTSDANGNGSWQAAAGGSSQPFSTSTALFKDGTDATKLMNFNLSGFTTATTRTWTVPNGSGTFARIDAGQTFVGTNTIPAPIITGLTTAPGSVKLMAVDTTTFQTYWMPATTGIGNYGSGWPILYSKNDSAIGKSLKGAGGITVSSLSDSTLVIDGSGVASSGAYKPTIGNTSNINTTAVDSFFYQKVGRFVKVSGYVVINVAANNAATDFTFTTPISSILGGNDIYGVVTVQNPDGTFGSGINLRYTVGSALGKVSFNCGAGTTTTESTYVRFECTYKLN